MTTERMNRVISEQAKLTSQDVKHPIDIKEIYCEFCYTGGINYEVNQDLCFFGICEKCLLSDIPHKVYLHSILELLCPLSLLNDYYYEQLTRASEFKQQIINKRIPYFKNILESVNAQVEQMTNTKGRLFSMLWSYKTSKVIDGILDLEKQILEFRKNDQYVWNHPA